ncbi:MAG: hypothetical protein KDC78_07535 [Aequorivita sp.]|nr:hypothetical protein [Aequorivita sp.]
MLPLIENQLNKIDTERVSPIPKMRFFEGKSGIENLFQDMLATIKERQYVLIKCFASNTLESQSHAAQQLDDYAASFLEELQKLHVHIETYLGNGILTLEQMTKTYDLDSIATLPAGNASLNLFVVGSTIYLIIFKQVPF